MSWNSLAGNQAVSGSNLIDAVNNGIFVVRQGQSIPNNSRCLTKDQINALINIATISGNRLVKKNELIAISLIYYLFTWDVTGSNTVDCNGDRDSQFISEAKIAIVDGSRNLISSHPDYTFNMGEGSGITVYNGQTSNGYTYISYECGVYYPDPYVISAPIPKYGG